MLPGTFSPERALALEDKLDLNLGQLEDRLRHFAGIVPGTPSPIVKRIEAARSEVAEIADELRAEIAKRTDSEQVVA